jgi:hypothetical protein
MTVDLYTIYRGLLQRARRNPESLELQEARVLGRALIQPEITKVVRKRIARSIVKIERKWGVNVSLGYRALAAIEAKDWTVNIPHQLRHRYEEANDDFGYFYIASASSRPGELKIGATTNSPYDRERTYKTRNGYPINVDWYKFLRAPFAFEKYIADLIALDRVACLTFGDSNEWYRHDFARLVELVEGALLSRDAP